MGVSVLTGRAARPGGDPALAGWRDLAEACPWSTPYGCPDLAQAWYEAHEAIFEPVVLYEQGADGQLEGLLALARHLTSGEIVPAVHRDASVYGWLARPLRGSYFLERALEAFGEHFPKQNLELEALPDGAPIDWAGPGRRLGRWARVESAHHWRMRFDPERAKKKLDKRANSQQVSGLKRRGEMRFERRLDAPTLERWLPDFARWFDAFAVDTGLSPRFEDHPEELTFWRRLTDGSESF